MVKKTTRAIQRLSSRLAHTYYTVPYPPIPTATTPIRFRHKIKVGQSAKASGQCAQVTRGGSCLFGEERYCLQHALNCALMPSHWLGYHLGLDDRKAAYCSCRDSFVLGPALTSWPTYVSQWCLDAVQCERPAYHRMRGPTILFNSFYSSNA